MVDFVFFRNILFFQFIFALIFFTLYLLCDVRIWLCDVQELALVASQLSQNDLEIEQTRRVLPELRDRVSVLVCKG